LDLPEVSLVAILDADKEGFLRSKNSLIQTSGRAARNLSGKVIFYADVMTKSMQEALSEMERRRTMQQCYNQENGITPQSIVKPINEEMVRIYEADYYEVPVAAEEIEAYGNTSELDAEIARLEVEMKEVAKKLEFEKAAEYRDRLKYLRDLRMGIIGKPMGT
jgi:excinuclease ABC subunit B